MNNISHAIDTRTPIEIALDVDKDGMTTARKLYAFLELDEKNYSRWCKTNITNNEFATEHEDYEVFVTKEENPLGGRPTNDYKLTAHFAKKLSVKGNGERAEQAREYFTTVEERVKQKIIKHSDLSPQLQLFQQMFEAVAEQEREVREAKQLAQKAIQTTDYIKQAVLPVTDNWRKEMEKKVRRVQYYSGKDFKELNSEMYKELENRASCNLNTRLRNQKDRMIEAGCRKSDVDKTRKIDIIENDKKLKEIFSKIVSEYEIMYCA